MGKKSVPICKECLYMRVTGRAICNGNNNGRPRGDCFCTHPEAQESFMRVCPQSPKMATFIGYTPMGGTKPQIKTSPRWCPLREKEGNER